MCACVRGSLHFFFLVLWAMSSTLPMAKEPAPTLCHEATDETCSVETRLEAINTGVAAERTIDIALQGALKPYQHVPWAEWPSWARGVFGRLHPSISGCAAFTAQMKDTGALTGPGRATTAAATQMGLQTKVVWSSSAMNAPVSRNMSVISRRQVLT